MMGNIFYLSGFMASGKSTIGPIVANTLGWDFIDLDEEIEKRENKKITKIFSNDGEEYFRKRESEILHEIGNGDKLIIALGGGTLLKPENFNFIRSTGKLIFLEISSQIAYNRLRYKKDRPVLIKIGEEIDEETYINRIEALMKKRKDIYAEADYTFNTDNVTVGETVNKIVKLIRNSFGTK
ncbi:MAG: shikimate kinase [Ignavibacterium sp.]|nr:MAG: shikimate kinase [Ignavibacterium sp.]